MIEYQGTQEAWDTFVAANAADGGVLQSWEWGEFQESLGRKIWRFVWGEQKIEAACLLVEHRLPLGLRYLYAPRGPIISQEHKNTRTQEHFFSTLVQFAKEQGAVFFRIEPPYGNFQFPISNFQCRLVPSVQPQQTLRIDLTKSMETLLSEMHEKTRYNTRLALKHRVRVENFQFPISNFQFQSFWTLMQETARRDGFGLHPKAHYKSLIDIAHCSLFIARYNDVPLATALVAFFGTTAYYLHGASSSVHRDAMAPYALHWAIMQEAKRRGCTSYDLWGIDEKRWLGVTRFKTGFAPHTLLSQYVGTFDVPIRKGLYTLYRISRRR